MEASGASAQPESNMLLSSFQCSFWAKGYHKGTVYVFSSKLKFQYANPTGKKQPYVTICFSDITSITKESGLTLLKRSCLKIKAMEYPKEENNSDRHRHHKLSDSEGGVEKEYYFADIANKEEVYPLLFNLWSISMEHRLERFRSRSGDLPRREESEHKDGVLPRSRSLSATSAESSLEDLAKDHQSSDDAASTIKIRVDPPSDNSPVVERIMKKDSESKETEGGGVKQKRRRRTYVLATPTSDATKKVEAVIEEKGNPKEIEGLSKSDGLESVPLEDIIPDLRAFSVSMDDKLFQKTTSDVFSTLISPRPSAGGKPFASTLMASAHPSPGTRIRAKSLHRVLVPKELEIIQTTEHFGSLFHLSPRENLLHEVECSCKFRQDEDQWAKGMLYITDHFAAFHATEVASPLPSVVAERAYKFITRTERSATRFFSLVIPFTEIQQIVRLSNKNPLIASVTTLHNIYDLSFTGGRSPYLKLWGQWRAVCDQVRPVNSAVVEGSTLCAWKWRGLPEDQVQQNARILFGDIEEEEREKERRWQEFLDENRLVLSADIVLSSELHHLVTEIGIPNKLRPKLWLILSGSLSNMILYDNLGYAEVNKKKQSDEELSNKKQDEGFDDDEDSNEAVKAKEEEGEEIEGEIAQNSDRTNRDDDACQLPREEGGMTESVVEGEEGERKVRGNEEIQQTQQPFKSYYQRLIDEHAGQHTTTMEEIEKDLRRSFFQPAYEDDDDSHKRHEDEVSEDDIKALRRVLTAYSWHNPEIGYCQSMNIVCVFLLRFLSEEETFWTMTTLCEHSLRDYYTKQMVTSNVDQRVFEVLLAQKLPKVYQHVKTKWGIPLPWFTLPWFLCLFIGKLPVKYVVQILDCFFCKGVCVLFQIGLALFKIAESEILKTPAHDGTDVILAHMLKTAREGHEDILFKVAFRDFGRITMDKIKELRNVYKSVVIKEMELNQKKNEEWKRKEKEREDRQARRGQKRQQQQQQSENDTENENENENATLIPTTTEDAKSKEEENEEDSTLEEEPKRVIRYEDILSSPPLSPDLSDDTGEGAGNEEVALLPSHRKGTS